MTAEFKLRPDAVNAKINTTVFKINLFVFLFICIGLAIRYAMNADHQEGYSYLISALVYLILFTFSAYFTRKMQRNMASSYMLTISDTHIGRAQRNTPALSMPVADITSIHRRSDGGYTIQGITSRDVIFVPAQIEDPERIGVLLNAIHPVTEKRNGEIGRKIKAMAGIAGITAAFIAFLLDNTITVIISASLSLLLLGYALYEIQQNKNIDRKTKNKMWWTLPLLLSIAGRLIKYITEL